MLSLTHLLLLTLIILLVSGPKRLPALGRSIGETLRDFKKALNGENEIDVTDSVKQIKDDDDQKS